MKTESKGIIPSVLGELMVSDESEESMEYRLAYAEKLLEIVKLTVS